MNRINHEATAKPAYQRWQTMALVALTFTFTIYLIWKVLAPIYTESSLPKVGNVNAEKVTDASIRKPMSTNEGITEPTRTLSTTSSSNSNAIPVRPGAELGLFDKPVRSLTNSNSLAKIDYAMSRIRAQCMSVVYNSNGVKPIEDNFSAAAIRSFGEGALNFGRAVNATRSAAYARSIEKCGKLYESERLSQKEIDALDSRPEGKAYQALREALFSNDVPKDFDSPQIKTAVEKVVAEPMFGLLSRLLLSHLEYEPLNNSYAGSVLPGAFPDIVSTLVLCRMGDDCGQGGVVTEQLCWLNAICGVRAEDAIMANMVERGIDVTALNEYVARVHRALQTGDTSIFRKPKK
jgi:hypothetical protein